MKPRWQIMPILVASLFPAFLTPNASGATPPPNTAIDTDLASYLRDAYPRITNTQIGALTNNPEFMTSVTTGTDITVETDILRSTPSNKSRKTTRSGCKRLAVRQRYKTGLPKIEVFSYTLSLEWCYYGHVVYDAQWSFLPDITEAGGYLGWKYKGHWKSADHHYYSWNRWSHGGYAVMTFPLFEQSQYGIEGAQVFGDFAARGHYDGTYTGHGKIT